jgi:hypothetical protein
MKLATRELEKTKIKEKTAPNADLHLRHGQALSRIQKREPAPFASHKSCLIVVAIFSPPSFFPSFRSFFFPLKGGERGKKKKEPEPQWKNDQKGSGSRG